MKMEKLKKLYVAALILVIAACAKTQNDEDAPTETMSYTSKSGKVELTIARSEYYISGAETAMREVQKAEKTNYKYLTATTAILQKVQIGTYPLREKYLKEKYPQLRIEPVLIPADRSARLLLNGGVRVKLEQGATMPRKVEENNYKATPITDEENTYLLSSAHPTKEVLNFVTQLQHTKGIEFAEPNFVRNTNQYEY